MRSFVDKNPLFKACSSKLSPQSALFKAFSFKALRSKLSPSLQSVFLKALSSKLLFKAFSFKASRSKRLPQSFFLHSSLLKAFSSKLFPQSSSLKAPPPKLSLSMPFCSSKLFLRSVVFKAVFERSLNIIPRSSHGSSTIGFHTECPSATGRCPLHLPEWSLGRDKL